jgi:hypothetical protein
MGITDFLNNLDLMYERMDHATLEWELFLEIWHQELGEKAFTSAMLAKEIMDNENLCNSLPHSLPNPSGKDFTRKLGNSLAHRNNVKYSNGFTVERAGEEKHAVKWRVVRYLSQNRAESSQGESSNRGLTRNSYKSESGELAASYLPININNKQLTGRGQDRNSPDSLPKLKSVSPRSEDSPETIEQLLGTSIEKAVSIWESNGAPVIHLGLGENCFNLRQLLSSDNPNPKNLKVIAEWLKNNKTEVNSPDEIDEFLRSDGML